MSKILIKLGDFWSKNNFSSKIFFSSNTHKICSILTKYEGVTPKTPKVMLIFRFFVTFESFYLYCAKRLLRSSGPAGASVRPSVRARTRPRSPSGHNYQQMLKNGPSETDLRAEISGSRVPFLNYFGISPNTSVDAIRVFF